MTAERQKASRAPLPRRFGVDAPLAKWQEPLDSCPSTRSTPRSPRKEVPARLHPPGTRRRGASPRRAPSLPVRGRARVALAALLAPRAIGGRDGQEAHRAAVREHVEGDGEGDQLRGPLPLRR